MIQIMIVEDTKMIAKILTVKLKKLGYEVVGVVSRGEDVVEMAMKLRPNLVLMDIVLEGKMDGVEAAANLKAQLDIPIIYLTSCTDDSTLERAKLTEPHGYLLKPLEEGELHTTIEMAIYKHDVEKKLKISEEWFSTTLNSIGDAVIATDIESYIKYINPAGESMTDYKFRKSDKKLLIDIFDIKNNRMVNTATNLVMQAISKGKNIIIKDCQLLMHNGREIPADITCAPIRDNKMQISGVVLVINDITEHKKSEERYIRLLQNVEMINKELMDFAHVVSHDLKAPLRAISSLANWLSEDYADKLDGDGRQQMELLINRVNRMNNMIDGILQYSRIGRIKEEATTVVIKKVVENVIDLLAPPNSIEIIIETELPNVKYGKVRMEQVFQNLIDNAIKYMDKLHGKISIGHSDKGSYWEFYVSDNGPGIDEKYFNKIFQLFQTLAPRDDKESTGIGLALTKKIVETHGGRIWLESVVGSGTKFYFTLPKT